MMSVMQLIHMFETSIDKNSNSSYMSKKPLYVSLESCILSMKGSF